MGGAYQSEPRTLAASAADVGGAFLEARPSVSCIMRNGALWEGHLRLRGWS